MRDPSIAMRRNAMSKRHAILAALLVLTGIALAAFLLQEKRTSVSTSTNGVEAAGANTHQTGSTSGEIGVSPAHAAPDSTAVGSVAGPLESRRPHEPFVITKRPDPFANGDVVALVARAEADPEAQYVLALLLHECNMAATRAIQDSLDEQALTKARERIAACNQLPPGLLGKRLDLLERAAEAGFLLAQVDYVTLGGLELTSERLLREPGLGERFRTNAVRFLQSAASRGSVDALGALATAYEDGVIVERDPRMAYAYTYAISLTNKTRLSGMGLARLGRDMTSSDVEEAQRIGQGIFNRCCR